MFKKRRKLYLGGLCLILDRGIDGKSVFDTVISVIPRGVKWIQLRDKESTPLQIYKSARIVKTVTAANGVKFIINDRSDIARAVEADGVHLGQEDLPLSEAKKIMDGKLIGISTHSLAQAVEAQSMGADYIGFGPIFGTKTKNAGPSLGPDAIRELLPHITIPIVAIGGINLGNLESVLDSGANAVAVASAITYEDDVPEAVERFMKVLGR
ncbi:MAG: thiamine phosphate synthase [Nitrospirae bacterium]|nr:thiamine phosphate synthase [Nitrospirota bacterium]